MADLQTMKTKMEDLAKWIKAKKKAEEMEKALKVELDIMFVELGMTDSVNSPSLTAYYMQGKDGYSIVSGKEMEAVDNHLAEKVVTTNYFLITDEKMLTSGVNVGILEKKAGKKSLAVRLVKAK